MAITGGCLCGKIRYTVSAEPSMVCHCHCEMCRRQTGAAMATFVKFPAAAVTWANDEPASYRSSKEVERSFCPTCGSSIAFHRSAEVFLCIGSLDKPADLPVDRIWTGHYWFDEHIAWFNTADDWKRYPELPPERAKELEQRMRNGGE